MYSVHHKAFSGLVMLRLMSYYIFSQCTFWTVEGGPHCNAYAKLSFWEKEKILAKVTKICAQSFHPSYLLLTVVLLLYF